MLKNKTDPIRLDNKEIRLRRLVQGLAGNEEVGRVALITIHDERVKITALSLADCFRGSYRINKIVVFQKRHYQALLEFSDRGGAEGFKSAMNNKSCQGLFFMRVQITCKKSLVVKSNNENEQDFTVPETNGPRDPGASIQ
jgi:hypothetical protein